MIPYRTNHSLQPLDDLETDEGDDDNYQRKRRQITHIPQTTLGATVQLLLHPKRSLFFYLRLQTNLLLRMQPPVMVTVLQVSSLELHSFTATDDPAMHGHPRQLEQHERAHCLARRPDQ